MAEQSAHDHLRILVIIGGGIAAYKTLDLIRRLRERGAHVRAIMTEGAQAFITPLTVGAITGNRVFTSLFDREEEHDIGHIRLARETDLIIVAPATADLMAKMAQGLAPDLACSVLLATKAPVLIAPAMNPAMWSHPATQRNLATLESDGIHIIGPEAGAMAESGEDGTGRMSEPLEIALRALALARLGESRGSLAGRHVLITAGPTHEPIDPVRVIANHSSGTQGFALARAAAAAGAKVTLISGPVAQETPSGVTRIDVEDARAMKAAVEDALPADIGIFAAAVADWRVADASAIKVKKQADGQPPALELTENPDILASVARSDVRPALLVGFAAETNDVVAHATAKLERKGCDLIVANDVSPETGIMGGTDNAVSLVSHDGVEHWESASKDAVAVRLIGHLAQALSAKDQA